jgi:RNA polymerase sigma factor (sigma-70 family)
MGDYAVKITVRNGRILRKMRECGIKSQAELARIAGLSFGSVNSFIAMREKAYSKSGEFRETAWLIASALGCEPEDLFNDQQRERALERNTGELFMDAPQVQALMSGDPEESSWAKIEVQRLLAALPNPQHQTVIRRRLDGETCEEIASDLGLSKGRVHQIEQKAIRSMREKILRSDISAAREMMISADLKGQRNHD